MNGAIDAGAQLLLVHHGMFWGGVQPLTDHRHQRLWALITHDVAVYSAHLPLDVHPELGNNALLAQAARTWSRGRIREIPVDRRWLERNVRTSRRACSPSAPARLAAQYGGQLVATPFDADRVTRAWGICSGAGADSATLREAAAKGLDTLIVGEGPHHTAVEARELGIVILYAGHYATETLGVRAAR